MKKKRKPREGYVHFWGNNGRWGLEECLIDDMEPTLCWSCSAKKENTKLRVSKRVLVREVL
jgi:hypothetical protein